MDIVCSVSGESARVMGDTVWFPALTEAVLELVLARALLLQSGFAAFELLLAWCGLLLWQGLEPAWLSQATRHPEPASSSAPAFVSSNSSCGFFFFIFPGLARSIDKCGPQAKSHSVHGSSPCMPMQTQPIDLNHWELKSPSWGGMSFLRAQRACWTKRFGRQ